MQYDAFLGEIQHRLELATKGDAAKVTRVVLNVLGERLGDGEASNLAAQLPVDLDHYLTEPQGDEQFSYQEFIQRIADRADVDESDAHFYAQAVVALLNNVVLESEVRRMRTQLPDEYDPLFEFTEADATPW